jgi:hypothetical protein
VRVAVQQIPLDSVVLWTVDLRLVLPVQRPDVLAAAPELQRYVSVLVPVHHPLMLLRYPLHLYSLRLLSTVPH